MWDIPEVREAITAARKFLKKESLIAYVKMAKAYLKTCRVAALDPFCVKSFEWYLEAMRDGKLTGKRCTRQG